MKDTRGSTRQEVGRIKTRKGRIFGSMFYVAALGLSILCVWRITNIPIQESKWILGWSLGGFVLAAVLGWRIGQLLEKQVRRGKGVWIPVGILGILLLLLPVYLCTHTDDDVSQYRYLLEGTASVLLIIFVVSTSYLLGYLLLPGKSVPARNQLIPLIGFLYACLLGGFIIGYSRYGYHIPLPAPVEEPEIPYKKALEETLQDFPGHITEKVDQEGNIHYDTFAQHPRKSSLHFILECYGPFPQNVIDADHGQASLDGYAIEMVDHQISPSAILIPGATGEPAAPQLSFPSLTQSDEPLARATAPRLPFPSLFVLGLVFTWPEGLDMLPVRCPILISPSQTRVPSGMYPAFFEARNPNGERFLVVSTGYPCLIPGPLEVWVDLWHGDHIRYTLPVREREILRTKHNAILFVKAYPGKFSLKHWDSEHHSLIDSGEDGPWTTALFSAPSPPGVTGICGIDAVGNDGGIYPGNYRWPGKGLEAVTFPCGPEAISEFRISEWGDFSRIRYRIPRVTGLPPENIGCRDLLNLQIPEILLRSPSHPYHVIRASLMEPSWGMAQLWPTSRDQMPEDTTFRGFLDHCWDDEWRIEKGYLITDSPTQVWKGGPFVRKIADAARTLRQ